MKHQHTFKKLLIAGLLVTGVTSVPGCYYDKEALLYPGSNQAVDCNAVAAKFSADVAPLIAAKCATSGCHDATGSGALVLQNYSQISGAKVKINTRAIVEKSMPMGAPLQPSEIKILKCWIESGAPNN